jgi:hypothetical protein
LLGLDLVFWRHRAEIEHQNHQAAILQCVFW